jgi:hypothetical protein
LCLETVDNIYKRQQKSNAFLLPVLFDGARKKFKQEAVIDKDWHGYIYPCFSVYIKLNSL